MSEFILTADGAKYTGWLDLSVKRSLDSFTPSFEFRYLDRWSGSEQPRPIACGSKCVVQFGTEVLITGYVDAVNWEATSEGLTVTASGRGATCDLVDSSVIGVGTWRNKGIVDIAKDLLKPFALPLTYDPQVGADGYRFDRFMVRDQDSVFDVLDRACRGRACTALTTPDGGVRLARLTRTAGLRTTRLDLNQCRTRSMQQQMQDRHSLYLLTGVTARTDPDENPRRSALQSHRLTDSNVTRYRPKIIHVDSGTRVGEARDQAQYEMNRRLGESLRISYSVLGIVAPDRKVWAPGQLVYVEDPQMGVRDVFMLASVEHKASEEEIETHLEMCAPEAFSIDPITQKEVLKGHG